MLEFDELLFDSLVPYRVRHLVNHLNYMTVPLRTLWGGGFDLRNGLTAFITTVLLLCVAVWEIHPQVQILSNAKDALCSGERGFVYTVDGAGSPAWSYVTSRTRPGTDYSGQPERPWRQDDSTVNFAQFVLSKVLAGDEQRDGKLHHIDHCPINICFNTSPAVIARRGGFPSPLPESLVEGDVIVARLEPTPWCCCNEIVVVI